MMKWSVPTVPDPCCKTLKRAWLGASNASRGRVLPGWWERGCYSKGSIYPFQESSNWFKFPKKKKDANRWYHGNSHEFVSKLKRLSNDFVLVQAGPCVYHQLTAPRMAGDLDDMRLLTTWDEKKPCLLGGSLRAWGYCQGPRGLKKFWTSWFGHELWKLSRFMLQDYIRNLHVGFGLN